MKMRRSQWLVFGQFFSLGLLYLPVKASYISGGIYWTLLCLFISLALAYWTFRHNHLGKFNIVPELKEGAALVRSGPYRWIRHPMYSSVTLLGLAALSWFAWWKILVLMVLLRVLYLKAKTEESLWCENTPEYHQYRDQTTMFIPFVL